MYSQWYHWFLLNDHCRIEWRIDEYSIKPVIRKDDIRNFVLFDNHISNPLTKKKHDGAPIPFLVYNFIYQLYVFIWRCLFMRVLYIEDNDNDYNVGDDDGGGITDVWFILHSVR